MAFLSSKNRSNHRAAFLSGPESSGLALGDKPVTVIEPQRGWISLDAGELWRYRELLFQLVTRDFSTKYRQSVLGVGWAFIAPLVTVAIYTLVFGRLARLPSDGIPYPVFSYAGLLPWLYFSNCLKNSSSSAVSASNLLTKVYFPRLLLPISKVVTGLIDSCIQLTVLGMLLLVYGVVPSWQIVYIPLFLFVGMITALGVGTWATALAVKYRDVNHAIQFLAQMWQWLTPIAYSANLVPERWRVWYWMNPMVGVVEGFRWSVLDHATPNWAMFGISTAVALLVLISGLYFFRRMEATFADVI